MLSKMGVRPPPVYSPPSPPPLTTRHPRRLPDPSPPGPGEKNSKFAGGFNACQFGRLSPYYETYFAAINMDQYDGACGRCVAVRGTGKRATGRRVVVKIVDACASCKHGDLDFTTKASLGGWSWVWVYLAGRRAGRHAKRLLTTSLNGCQALAVAAAPPC